MTFLAAGWLTLLLPWAVVVVWSWRRVSDERATTAAFLWEEKEPVLRRDNTRRGRPPTWVIAALLAVLAAILALSQPAQPTRTVRLNVIVDGAVDLSARSAGRSLREDLIDRLEAALRTSGVRVAVDSTVIGIDNISPISLDEARSAPVTARPTDRELTGAIAAALENSDAIVVLSDKPTLAPRVVQIAPDRPADNVGIVTAVAVATPRPSVMVTIANDSDRTSARLVVRGASETADETRDVPVPIATTGPGAAQLSERVIALPPRGGVMNVFVDVESLPNAMEVALIDLRDSIALDDSAVLLHQHQSVKLSLEGKLPAVATRFAAAFERSRGAKPSRSSRAVTLFAGNARSSGESIIFAAPGKHVRGAVEQAPHAALRDIDLARMRIDEAAVDVPSEFRTIASKGGTPIVAVRDSPRSVWFGFEPDPLDVQSVVLLANALDWIGDGGPAEWRGVGPDEIGADWQPRILADRALVSSPGRYLDSDAREVAVNLPAIVGPHARSRDDVASLLVEADRDSFQSLTRPLAILAAVLAAAAAVLCRGRGLA